MRTLVRRLTSWQSLLLSTALTLPALAMSFWIPGLRTAAATASYALAFMHFCGSTWLWRAYTYGNADYDSPNVWVPGGLSKSMFLLAGFIILLGASLAITITDIEQGCPSALTSGLGLFSP
ncbi:hypothetical protein NCCP1664_24780 [Zafaria cholistanensis]|uniref:Uncharacterized protein n=1 Tax=Zafaria cholistanensis TaxID=1682741 RepID=A0A5A7NT73_9MICC|nr:hypothetical protein [Zafaria cholistanensis]GER23983.1 hypothetical protein NCCP1664_24780 [Zafaria cholistanensis]